MTNEERLKLVGMLVEIENDPEKVLVHELFDADQWLQYNPQKDWFEYEDHIYLGEGYDDVINLLQSVSPKLVMPSKWHIEPKKVS